MTISSQTWETHLTWLFSSVKKVLPLEVELALVWQEGIGWVQSLGGTQPSGGQDLGGRDENDPRASSKFSGPLGGQTRIQERGRQVHV